MRGEQHTIILNYKSQTYLVVIVGVEVGLEVAVDPAIRIVELPVGNDIAGILRRMQPR
eukprot:COSAG04_NODE_1047_length_8562_cov_9.403167_19_plen_58_part_00